VEAIGTEAGSNAPIRRAFFPIHKPSITQEAALMDAGGSRILTRPVRQTIETLFEVESPPDSGTVAALVPAKASSTRGRFNEQRRGSGAN
jgi:hypothetical protein